MMIAVNSSNRHLARLSSRDDAAFFATVMFNAATSNMQQTFVLSKMDENVEWNIWSHPFPAQTVRWSVMPTNH